MMKYFYTLFLSLVCVLNISNLAHAQHIQTSAKQAIVIDYDTGAVLYEKNADERMPTSSMSKVITAYAVFDALKNSQFSLDDTFQVSEKAWRKGGSKMFVEVNKDVRIDDLLRGVIIQSGNDATIVLAEGLAGSEEAFAERLNQIAGKLGMENSNFTNASGWPDDNHYSSARDLSILGKALIKNFPEYYPYYSEKEFTYNAITQQNRNPLLHQNIGADGIKTGHTDAGGYGLIGSGTSNDRRVILVINGLEDEAARAQESKKLLQWGLQSFKNEALINANQVVDQAPVMLGKSESIGLAPNTDIIGTMPFNAAKNVKITIRHNEPILAPIAQGQELGQIQIEIPGQDAITAPLFATQSVEKLGFFASTLTKAKLLASGL